MTAEEALSFRTSRDLGEVISATFAYLRQTWRSLGKALLYIAGPLLAVQVAASSLYQGRFAALRQPGATPEDFADAFGSLAGPLLVFLPVSLVVVALSVAVVYAHMQLYRTHGPGAVEVGDVWAGVKRSFGSVLATTLVAFLCSVLSFGLVMGIGGVAIGGLTVGAGPLGAALGVLLMLLGGVCAGAYLLVFFALFFPVRVFEETGMGAAFGRCRRLLKDTFWQSLGIVFVVVLLYYVIAMGFSMPASIMGFIWGFGGAGDGKVFQVALIAANVLGGIGGTVAYCIPLVATALYYFGLVEAKEHTGLAERVEQVGPGDSADENQPSGDAPEDRSGERQAPPSFAPSGPEAPDERAPENMQSSDDAADERAARWSRPEQP